MSPIKDISPGAKVAVVMAVALVCTVASWGLGWGFRRESWLTAAFGWTLFGSDVYMGVWFVFMAMPVVGFLVPALVIRYVFGERLADYGLALGDTRAGAIALLVLVPGYTTLPLLSSALGTEYYYDYLVSPEFLAPWKVAVHFTSYAAMMFGYEFLFRGFVLFGVARALGGTAAARRTALAVSVALSALFFVGTPWVFILAFPVLALAGGLVTFRTRSILYFTFVNWMLGIWSDAWEIIKLNA